MADCDPDLLPDLLSQQQLAHELDLLIRRVQAALGGTYAAPPFSPSGLLRLVTDALERFSPELAQAGLARLRQVLREDILNVETWKGVWFVVNYSLELQAGFLRRRLAGDYEVDPWGLDREFLEVVRPFFEFMYKTYWRVETAGLENIPAAGRGLLVANHSGQIPWDGMMVATAVLTEHPAGRLVRNLYANWFPTLPFFSTMLVKLGQALATVDNGTRLLEQDELVGVYPEGYKGVGKLYKDRYRLARFGRGGFVKMALRTAAPIIPVSIVGAEETYISLAKSDALAKLTGVPYFPISPTFPWLGLFGLVPLPTKWYIDVGEPVAPVGYGPEAAEDPVLVGQISDDVRGRVQQQLYRRLRLRNSIFFGE